MDLQEFRFFCRIPQSVWVGFQSGAAESTSGRDNCVVYFTREQFVVGLRFPLPSLVKQFLHVTEMPPYAIHPNIIRV